MITNKCEICGIQLSLNEDRVCYSCRLREEELDGGY